MRPQESPSWPAFLRGYTECRRLGEADLAAIPIFVALRELWLLGVRAANVPDWGILWLDDRLDRGIRFLKEREAARQLGE